MRTIKFRAWDGSRMIMPKDKSYYQHYMSFCGCIIQKSSEGMECFGGGDRWRVVGDLSLMQSTGWSDSEGVEIYEGDVVECDEHYYYEISWSEKHASWYASEIGGLDELPRSVKVIGNIYQNPELLK